MRLRAGKTIFRGVVLILVTEDFPISLLVCAVGTVKSISSSGKMCPKPSLMSGGLGEFLSTSQSLIGTIGMGFSA